MYVYIIYAELSVGRVDPRVGSGRVQKFLDFRGSGRVQSLCVCIFVISRYFEDIRNFDRQLHNYVGWLITRVCMPTICKCEETLCVEQ